MLIVEDSSLLRALGSDVVLGGGFAFVTQSIFRRPAMAWVRSMLAAPDGTIDPKVVSLLRPGGAVLPGARVQSRLPCSLDMATVVSDRAHYRMGIDTVHLLAVNPRAPRHQRQLFIKRNQRSFAERIVQLDRCGMSSIQLLDLPAGDYSVALRGGNEHRFLVSEYRLMPLSARCVEQRIEKGLLQLSFVAEQFGRSAMAEIRVRLMNRSQHLGEQVVCPDELGYLHLAFPVSEPGPYAAELQLGDAAAAPLRILLPALEKVPQEPVLLSRMGRSIVAFCDDELGTDSVRGLRLQECGEQPSPIAVARVAGSQVDLTAQVDLVSLKVVVVDPRVPQPSADAADPRTVAHPSVTSPLYRQGEEQFRSGNYERALAIFEQERGKGQSHPNYAYFVACCHALRGDTEAAFDALADALRAGWLDFSHLSDDGDLAALHGLPRFEMLKAGGVREVDCPYLEKGEDLSIEVPSPIALLAVAAYVADEPWEGWLVAINPSSLDVQLEVPERAIPGTTIEIEVKAATGTSGYLVVRDKRVEATDALATKLAQQLADWAKAAPTGLRHGIQGERLKDRFMADTLGPHGPTSHRAGPSVAPPGDVAQSPSPPAVAPGTGRNRTNPEITPSPLAAGGFSARTPMLSSGAGVVFAGWVKMSDGCARVAVELPPPLADYEVSVFCLNGFDWGQVRKSFKAQHDPFAELNVPRFVHPADVAVATARIHTSRPAGVEIRCNDEPVPLYFGPGERNHVDGSSTLVFEATPGHYRVEVASEGSEAFVHEFQLDPPGVERRRVEGLRMTLRGHTPVVAPAGPDTFRPVVGYEEVLLPLVQRLCSVAERGCEPTVARLLGGLVLHGLSEDRRQRSRAEAIVAATARELSELWAPGRGFRSHRHSAQLLQPSWGCRIVRFVRHILTMDPIPVWRAIFGRLHELAQASAQHYGMPWQPVLPSDTIASCEDAYYVYCFNQEALHCQRALALVEHHAGEHWPGPPDEFLAGRQGEVVEAAFAAATMLRAGDDNHSRIVALANRACQRLWLDDGPSSTVEAAAAVALLLELRRSSSLKPCELAANGRVDGFSEGASLAVLPHQVSELELSLGHFEELHDWSSLGGSVEMHVRLEQEGEALARCGLGQIVTLRAHLLAGFRFGDQLLVSLPHALAPALGRQGGTVLRCDFEGHAELAVPLITKARTIDIEGTLRPQRFSVCMHNRYDERRRSKPTWLRLGVG